MAVFLAGMLFVQSAVLAAPNAPADTVTARQAEEIAVLQTDMAESLKKLRLFRGTENGFELDRQMTRAEGITMLVRALGKEEEAKTSGKTHPFTDVPAWADGYVSYAYSKALTNGVSETSFNPDAPISSEEYIIFLLRSLGHTDYRSPFVRAADCVMLPPEVNLKDFRRGDAVMLTVCALFLPHRELQPMEFSAPINIGNETLHFEKLIREGVLSEAEFEAVFPKDPFSAYRRAAMLLKRAIAEQVGTDAFIQNTFHDDLCFITDFYEENGTITVEAAVVLLTFGDEADTKEMVALRAEFDALTGDCIAYNTGAGSSFDYISEQLGEAYDLAGEAMVLGIDWLIYRGRTQILEALPGEATEILAETEPCTVYLSGETYLRTNKERILWLVYKPGSLYGAGRMVFLRLPMENAYKLTTDFDGITVSEDGKTLRYTLRLAADKWDVGVEVKKGLYTYAVDLETARVYLAEYQPISGETAEKSE